MANGVIEKSVRDGISPVGAANMFFLVHHLPSHELARDALANLLQFYFDAGFEKSISNAPSLYEQNAIMKQALVCVIEAWDSDDDSMGTDPAEIARSALEQIGYA